MKIYDKNGNLLPLPALAVDLGEMDDTATADNLSDITTTSALAKLRRLLLRFSSGAFSVDLDNSINTDLDALWTALGTLIGTRGEVAHEGNAETAVSGMAYIKQLVNELRILDAIVDNVKAIALTIEESYLGSPTYGLSPIWEKLSATKIDTTNIYNLVYNAEMGFLMRMWSNLCRWGQIYAINGNSFTSPHLAGMGVDAMPAGWYVYVMQADNAAPEGEYRLITDYADDGTVTHEAFSVALEVGDRVQLLHPVLGMLGQVDTAAASGAVTTTDFMMAYVKQLVTLLRAITAAGPTLAQMNTAHGLLATPAQVATALNTYDAIKRSEATSDKDEVIAAMPTGLALSSDWKGNFNWDTSVNTTAETDISTLFSTNLALTTRRKYSVKLDLTAVEADGSFSELYLAVKEKIDGSNYRAIDRKTVTAAQIAATAEPGIVIDIPATSENIHITMQMETALSGDVAIYYSVVKEHLE